MIVCVRLRRAGCKLIQDELELKVSPPPARVPEGRRVTHSPSLAEAREGLDVHAVEFSKTEPTRPGCKEKAPDSHRRPLEVDTNRIRLLSKGFSVVSRVDRSSAAGSAAEE
jgi:hypothetical protein